MTIVLCITSTVRQKQSILSEWKNLLQFFHHVQTTGTVVNGFMAVGEAIVKYRFNVAACGSRLENI